MKSLILSAGFITASLALLVLAYGFGTLDVLVLGAVLCLNIVHYLLVDFVTGD